MQIPPFRMDSFRWLVGLFCGLLGTMMLVTPHQFRFLENSRLYGNLYVLGVFLLAVGIGVLLEIVLSVPRWLELGIYTVCALILWTIAAALLSSHGWVNGISLIVLGLAVFLNPFLSSNSKAEAHAAGDFFGLTIGFSTILTGGGLLLNDLSSFSYLLSGGMRLFFGLGFLLSGAILALIQIPGYSLNHRALAFASDWAYRLVGLLYLAFVFFAARPDRIWTAFAYFGWFGLALLMLPRIFSPFVRLNPAYLQTRLALAFGLASSLPLIFSVVLLNWMNDPSVSTIRVRNLEMERDVIMAVLLLFILLTVYAGTRLATYLVSPLRPLSIAARAVAEGDMDVPLPSSAVVEVQYLTNAFIEMRARMAQRTLESEQARAALEDHQRMLEVRVAERTSALALSNQRMEALLSALPVGVMISDANGAMVDKNAIIDRIWGGEAPMVQKISEYEQYQSWRADSGDPIRPEDWAIVRALRNGETFLGEVIDIRRFDGSQGTILSSAAPIRDEKGVIQGGVAVIQDISQQREIERIAREAAHKARKTAVEIEAVFNAQSDAVILYGQDGVVQQANSRAVAMFGFDPVRMTSEQVARKIGATGEDGRRITGDLMPSSKSLAGQTLINMRVTFRNVRRRNYIALVSASQVYVGQEVVGVVAVWHDITERERLMKENRRQRELLERLVKEAPAGIAFLEGADFRYTLVNTAYEHIARGKGDLIGRSVAEIWPEVSEELLPLLTQVYSTGESFRAVDYALFIRRGEEIEQDFFTFNFIPISGPTGQDQGIMVLALETTEEVRARSAIEEERARLHAVIENAPEGIMLIDSQGKLLLSNPAAERIFGSQPESMPPDSDSGFTLLKRDGSPYSQDEDPLRRAARQGETCFNVEVVLEIADGRQVPLLMNTAPVRERNGPVIGAVAIFQDISEIIQTERALRESEQRFRGLVESMNDIIFTLNSEQKFTGIFGLGLEKLGLTVEDALGKTVNEVLGEDNPIHAATFERVMKGRGQLYEWSTQTRAGTTHFQNSVAPLHDEFGRVCGVVGVTRDITALKRAEQALENYAGRLRRSNQELEQFAFIASHDLQEPLRKIQAFGQRVQRSMQDRVSEDELDYLNRMVSASERMQKMISDLLAFSRVTTKGQPFTQVDLRTVVNDVISDLELRIERSHAALEVGELPQLEADSMQMHQLFQNLLANALKYLIPGNPPKIQIYAELSPSEADYNTGNTAEQVRIYVQDNGIGFDTQYLERIFQPFERLHGRGEYEGTGMGLAICQKIVERHRGTITAQSEPGHGALFVITLPVKQTGERA